METQHRHPIIIPVVLLIIAYEWLISAVNKLVTKNYLGNLHDQMSQSISGITFKPYASLVKTVGLPSYHVFGILVLLGELFVGITFVIIAIRKFQGFIGNNLSRLGFVASIVAAFMSLNYALLGGDTLFVDPANAFQEGISIDWVLCLVEVSFAAYFYSLAQRKIEVVNDKRRAA